jgi:hypothetical protein
MFRGFSLPLLYSRGSVTPTLLSRDCEGAVRSLFRDPENRLLARAAQNGRSYRAATARERLSVT